MPKNNDALRNIKQALADAEDAFNAATDSGDERFSEARARMRDNLRAARNRLTDAEIAVRSKGREVARATDVYVHENPYRSIGVAGALGLLIGVLLTRR